MPVTSKLMAAGLSDPGRVRRENEDRIHVDAERGVFVVADGLGGHAAGERAAQTAIEMIVARLGRQTGATEDRIREAIAVANNEIYRLAHENPEWKGMASVVTVAVVEDEQVTVGHVGDSRLYILEPGTIRKITHDHSPVGEREDAGELKEAAAMAHPRRNEVFRDLGNEEHGPDDEDFVEILREPLGSACALLLCSDGLSDQVPSAQIRTIVEDQAGSLGAATRALVRAANDAGGKDNVSVILVETPGYAARLQPNRAAASGSKPSLARLWLALLAGALSTAALFAFLKPHLAETTAGQQLRYGVARGPLVWEVKPGAGSPISDALKKAQPGDTVVVEPGTYKENVTLRDGVSLISSQRNGAVLDAKGTVVQASGTHHATVAGFRIMGDGETGIRLVNSDVEVTGVEVTGMREAGIEIGGESSGAVRACMLKSNAGTGIRVHGAARPLIGHNVITGNGKLAGHLRPGLEIEGSSAPVVAGNIIADNGAEQVWISPLFDAAALLSQNAIAGGGPRDRNRQVKVVTR
jgi:PPM family protein phosphatase